MSGINWKGVDLNLLLTFEAIMICRSVSGASERLHLGQPATSYNLKRLRTLLGDPLFERQGNVMVPTQRALEVSPKISTVLSIIRDDILLPNAFEPQEYHDKFVIGLSDYAEQVFGPALFDQLLTDCPNSQILFKAVDPSNCESALESGDIDLAIGVFKTLPDTLLRTFLYRERHVCLFDNSVLKVDLPINLDDYLSTPQMVITANRELSSPVDITLADINKKRRVVLGSTRFLTLRHMLLGRRLLCVMAELVGRSAPQSDGITLCQAPIPIPDFDIEMISRLRDSEHPKQKWLTNRVQWVIQQKVTELVKQ
ncbi:LysR family transcriptional regulator [Photobacterium sp. BZF1]|uniref:LysR family transcriptional regulator n=1 Tax=Photobacterium sp. BZF1 TaxID=1904457 RepID=UPI00165372A8|nr:LysR family transcriptional regulator [Photobacterium sp. BZF1]MBC7004774.1 LysR family transcriptional regulator [Photobacterium sp. BZF1]